MIDFSDSGTIYYTGEAVDEDGREFWTINGDTHYPKSSYTLQQAKADYQTEKAMIDRADSRYRAWCD